MTSVVDFEVKVAPLIYNWLLNYAQSLEMTSKEAETEDNRLFYVKQAADIRQIVTTMIFSKGAMLEELSKTAQFYKVMRGHSLSDFKQLAKIHFDQLKKRPVRLSTEAASVVIPEVKPQGDNNKQIMKNAWSEVQTTLLNVHSWDKTQQLSSGLQSFCNKYAKNPSNSSNLKRKSLYQAFQPRHRGRGRGRGKGHKNWQRNQNNRNNNRYNDNRNNNNRRGGGKGRGGHRS
jgi:hypothetical protein